MTPFDLDGGIQSILMLLGPFTVIRGGRSDSGVPWMLVALTGLLLVHPITVQA